MAIGSLAVILICGLTCFNDYVVENTYMIGSYLPLAMVLVMFFLCVVVNGLLFRLMPRYALKTGELAVILFMLLLGCSLPSQGLMRSLLPLLVAPFRMGCDQPRFWTIFTHLACPTGSSPFVISTVGAVRRSWMSFTRACPAAIQFPYGPWIIPLLGWGVFFLGLSMRAGRVAWITRRQWAINERLPFPLAQLELSLIERRGAANASTPCFAAGCSGSPPRGYSSSSRSRR